jgi:hypothetical protein
MSKFRTAVSGAARRSVFVPTPIDATQLLSALTHSALGLTLILAAVFLMDDRTLADEAIWTKPLKFSASFAVFFGTLALIVARFSTEMRHALVLVTATAAGAAAYVFEQAYITAQAARAELSHFNESTPWHEAMYEAMGHGATAMMVLVGVVGVTAALDRGARLAAPLREGVWIGCLLTVVLTFWVAGELAGNGGRYIGQPTPGGPVLPLVGWSMEVGDLRPAHFLALHALQVLPLVGLLAQRNSAGVTPVRVAAGLYSLLTAVVFWQALQGVPIISAG